jgi:hypothetical protein
MTVVLATETPAARRRRLVAERNAEEAAQAAAAQVDDVENQETQQPTAAVSATNARSAARDRLRNVSRVQQRSVTKQSRLATLLQADGEAEPDLATTKQHLPPALSFVFSVTQGTPLEAIVKHVAADHFTVASVETKVARAVTLLPLRTALATWRNEVREIREAKERFQQSSAVAVRGWQCQFRVTPALRQWEAFAKKRRLLASATCDWAESTGTQLLSTALAPLSAATTIGAAGRRDGAVPVRCRGGGMRNSRRRAALYELREHALNLHAHRDLARYVIGRMNPNGRAMGRALLRWLDYSCERLEYLSTIRAAAIMLSVDLRRLKCALIDWLEVCEERKARQAKVIAQLEKQSTELRCVLKWVPRARMHCTSAGAGAGAHTSCMHPYLSHLPTWVSPPASRRVCSSSQVLAERLRGVQDASAVLGASASWSASWQLLRRARALPGHRQRRLRVEAPARPHA